MQNEQDFYDMTWAYLQRAKQDNVTHTEIFFDPQTHSERGVEFSTVVEGISRALQDAEQQLNISSCLIMCFLRHLSEESAMNTLAMAQDHLGQLTGVGLDSAERGNPPEKFQRVFAQARQQGLRAVAHAGEEGPADYIWQALQLLQVERIDHGVGCFADSQLVDYLRDNATPLTVCPNSNIQLAVFPSMEEHNLKKMLDHGLCATVNSDDPAYFSGYINDNFFAVQDQLTREDVIQLAKNSFQASFLSDREKARHLDTIDVFVKQQEQA